jgi:hypothetical protein
MYSLNWLPRAASRITNSCDRVERRLSMELDGIVAVGVNCTTVLKMIVANCAWGIIAYRRFTDCKKTPYTDYAVIISFCALRRILD